MSVSAYAADQLRENLNDPSKRAKALEDIKFLRESSANPGGPLDGSSTEILAKLGALDTSDLKQLLRSSRLALKRYAKR